MLITDLIDIYIHCFQKTFDFLSVSNGSTSILSDIVNNLTEITGNHFCVVFLKNQEYLREMFLGRLRDVTEKKYFLRYARDVLNKSHKRYRF